METQDLDSDEEADLHDLKQLEAVIEFDKQSTKSLVETASQCTASSLTVPNSSFSFTSEYSKIEAALALNKLTEEKLRRLEKIMIDRLHECREKLKEVQTAAFSEKSDKPQLFRYIVCGKPYFKDKNNFPAPVNVDTKLMEKAEMYDFSHVTSVPGWSVRDKSSFISLIHKISQTIKERQLNSQIAQIKRDSINKNSKKMERKILAIEKQKMDLKNQSLSNLALPLDQEYDWDFIANKLNKKHSAEEYRSLWQLFLHPSINKSAWNKQDHNSLVKIANKYNMQDWDSIANELGIGRSGYQCFVYFRTNMSNTFTGQRWTKEEEEYLKRLVNYYREDDYIPWGKVASAMENRTKIQIYNKYSRLIEKRKGRFVPEEDAVILTFVDKFGPNFKKMAEYIPGRSPTQLRIRYQIINKSISSVWTVDEDKTLIKLLANQDSKSNFSDIIKYFPGKDRQVLRTRYMTLVKWMTKHPNQDLIHAPRRGARRLCHGSASDNLNKAVETLKQRIQTEVDNKKKKRISKDSPHEVLDDAIIATLVAERVKEEESKRQSQIEDEMSSFDDYIPESLQSLNVTNVKNVLILLRSKLQKSQIQNSYFSEHYPELTNDVEVQLVKKKSYSRKNQVEYVKLDGPNIFGSPSLNKVDYVLPPHYATLTGCRKLMEYASVKGIEQNQQPLNISLLVRRNDLLKKHWDLLIERFSTLFLWPILLSNEHPPQQLYAIQNKLNDLDDNELVDKELESNLNTNSNVPSEEA